MADTHTHTHAFRARLSRIAKSLASLFPTATRPSVNTPKPHPSLIKARQGACAIAILASIIAVIVYVSAYGLPGSLSTSGPRLEMPAFETTNLGDGKIGQVLEGVITIRNRGSKGLTFQVDPGCGCAYVKPSAGEVGSDDTQLVRIGVRLQHEGTERNLRVRISTNDPSKPIAEHVFRARCPALLQVRPQVADFGQVAVGSTATVALDIRDPDGVPWNPVERKGLDFRCLSESVAVEVDSTSPSQLRLIVKLRPTAALGPVGGAVLFTLAGDDRELSVPILGEVCGPIRHAPANVRFGLDSNTGQWRKATLLVWRTDRDRLGRLIVVQKPAWLDVEETGSLGNPRRSFRLAIVGEPDEEPSEQIMRLQFEGAEEEVAIPIEARHRNG